MYGNQGDFLFLIIVTLGFSWFERIQMIPYCR
jgi:hypothetical protein